MFGYVKPFVPDLRVREHEMYRAIYCGLCRSMGKRTGCASRLTLSYDFTFLAAVRLALEEVSPVVRTFRCAASPLKRRPLMEDNAPLSYCAAAAAVLTRAKVQDDIADSRGSRRLSARLLLPHASAMEKKALSFDSSLPVSRIEESLSRLSRLESEGCPSLDTVSTCFGEVLSLIFSCGLSGGKKAIASAIGHSLGKIIYVLDCADDREDDLESGSYNPLNIEPMSDEALLIGIRLELEKASRAVDLIDFSGKTELSQIILNTICEGIPKEAERILKKCPAKEKS